MTQLLELKEFETVIGNPDYKDTYKCMDQDAFADLIAFIHAFDADDANVEESMEELLRVLSSGNYIE